MEKTKMEIKMNKLKKWRHSVAMTQKELAEKIGVTEQTIYNIESGSFYPRATTIDKLTELSDGKVAKEDFFRKTMARRKNKSDKSFESMFDKNKGKSIMCTLAKDGWPKYLIISGSRICFIDIMPQRGKPSQVLQETAQILEQKGFPCYITRSPISAIEFLKNAGFIDV